MTARKGRHICLPASFQDNVGGCCARPKLGDCESDARQSEAPANFLPEWHAHEKSTKKKGHAFKHAKQCNGCAELSLVLMKLDLTGDPGKYGGNPCTILTSLYRFAIWDFLATYLISFTWSLPRGEHYHLQERGRALRAGAFSVFQIFHFLGFAGTQTHGAASWPFELSAVRRD